MPSPIRSNFVEPRSDNEKWRDQHSEIGNIEVVYSNLDVSKQSKYDD